MKKCPQCDTVYEDEVVYCLNDGSELVEEIFMLQPEDSIEAETIIRHDPIVVDLSEEENEIAVGEYQMPSGEKVIVIPAETTDNTRNYAIFLILGLLIGGGLVLATILFMRNKQGGETNSATRVNVNLASSGSSAPTARSTVEIAPAGQTPATEPVSDRHAAANPTASDATLNGRVIVLNARVRSAPSINAAAIDTLPLGDRLNIVRRENSGSPWYQIECEHGASGWMHGDTIEFTR